MKPINTSLKTPRLLSLIGRSNAGKTTLITRLLPLFCQRGLRVGSIKHTHHHLTFDQEGKDSWKHRQAGSSKTLLISDNNLAVYSSHPPEQSLVDTVATWFPGFDLVIAEGFKYEQCLHLEVHRQEIQKPPLYLDPSFSISALISDYPAAIPQPQFRFDELDQLFAWTWQRLGFDLE